MRIISIKKLKDFWEQGYANSEQPLKVWYQIFKKENFTTPNEIKLLFPSCSIINNNRIIFNISGNKYRLITHIRYDLQIVYIRFVGTHAEYDKINVKEI
ncbi:toxin RelE [Rickettsia asiatica]|uniref:Toxin RelE n=1 Tax=Rickettsia asiatica TaxID=238800 RepID=A0A510GAX7_9RICK|nr:type II toxin-antitoxin system HigB family toxin [Rickettsia asiatica]BBJ32055.1 toxin RelE [Rickettsia asiatica]